MAFLLDIITINAKNVNMLDKVIFGNYIFEHEGQVTMSINAITSVSLYEYYYKINKEDEKRKKSPLADEMEKYGLRPTDDEALNAILLQNAKALERSMNSQNKEDISPSDRPWADIMYQLNLQFNDDPKDDIQDIKDELAELIRGIDDEELEKEVKDLESHVENLYINFEQNSLSMYNSSVLLSKQLNNLSLINQANLF